MKSLVLATIAALFATALVAAQPDELRDPDVQCLIQSPFFAFGGIGYAGTTSDGEAAFGRIVRKKESARYLLAAFEHGSDNSRCYALVGLRETSPELYRRSLAWFRQHGPRHIKTISGCIAGEKPTPTILNDIDGGTYAEFFRKYEAP